MTGKWCECGHLQVDHLHNGQCVINRAGMSKKNQCQCTGFVEDPNAEINS